jgi:hypothetical protein
VVAKLIALGDGFRCSLYFLWLHNYVAFENFKPKLQKKFDLNKSHCNISYVLQMIVYMFPMLMFNIEK